MISKVSYNISNKNRAQTSFKGYKNESYNLKSKNAMDSCIHETSFFRNLETLDFAKKYLISNFPQGTNIADFGCSNGEETYSILMLLNKHNKDKKYKITGYDISPKVINLAQGGPFKVQYRYIEGVINSDFEYKQSDRKDLRQTFFDCFEDVPANFLQYNPKDGDMQYVKKRIQEEKDLKKLLDLKCFREILKNRGEYQVGKSYKPKQDFVADVVDFKLGDINDMSKVIGKDKKNGVIIFKNAWYHVMDSHITLELKKIKTSNAMKIIKSAHKSLPKNGLFVVGNLDTDHIYIGDRKQKSHSIIQDGKQIDVCDNTFFHKLLKKRGFAPVFFEQIKGEYGEIVEGNIYLPSVWRRL